MASTIGKLKLEIVAQVESQRTKLIELSKRIHDNPELGFREEKSCNWLSEYLAECGFGIQKNISKFPTAFKASFGKGKPVVALLAEYDALPEVGHACGHNIIGVAAAGGGVASKCAVDACGGTVVVLGTPAEELAGGKILLIAEGIFNDFDAAMLVHPGTKNLATIKSLACATIEVEFFGRAAHAAGHPEKGINALDALISSYNSINSLRQHIKEESRIHGIITNGGKAANIVPDYASALFMVRANQSDYLAELQQRVLDCFTGAALATGTQLKYKWSDQIFAPMKSNNALATLFSNNLESLGRKVDFFDPDDVFGSTDMGNVSQIVPAIHPEIAITNASVHTIEFAEAAISSSGNHGLLDAAKALAMTIADLLYEPENLVKVRDEFMK